MSDQIKTKRQRSPSFPYMPLSKCIGLVEKLHNAANVSFVRIDAIAEFWNVTAYSGSHLRYVSALSEFELIETQGSGKERKIKLSQDAVRILEDQREGVREELLAKAAIKPRMINTIFNGSENANFTGWGFVRPADSIAVSALKFDFKFTTEGAKKFLSIYDDCLKYLQPSNILQNEIHDVEEVEQKEKFLKSFSNQFFESPFGEKQLETEPNSPQTEAKESISKRNQTVTSAQGAAPITFDMKTITVSGQFKSAAEVNDLIESLNKLLPLMPK